MDDLDDLLGALGAASFMAALGLLLVAPVVLLLWGLARLCAALVDAFAGGPPPPAPPPLDLREPWPPPRRRTPPRTLPAPEPRPVFPHLDLSFSAPTFGPPQVLAAHRRQAGGP
jgi:hypothetical protein